jgi:hypothetical protein
VEEKFPRFAGKLAVKHLAKKRYLCYSVITPHKNFLHRILGSSWPVHFSSDYELMQSFALLGWLTRFCGRKLSSILRGFHQTPEVCEFSTKVVEVKEPKLGRN